MSEQTTRLIEVSTELMDTFGGRTLDGKRLSYEWGEPTATAGVHGGIELAVYTPTITAVDDGWLREQREQAATEARRANTANPCRDCGGTGVQRPHSHTARCLDPVRREADCDKADLDRILARRDA